MASGPNTLQNKMKIVSVCFRYLVKNSLSVLESTGENEQFEELFSYNKLLKISSFIVSFSPGYFVSKCYFVKASKNI